MNKRLTKKVNSLARCFFLAGKSTSIERGYLAVYFREYPLDFRKVRKWLRRVKNQEILSKLKKDVSDNYKHPCYTEEKKERVFYKLRNGNFIPYLATSVFDRAFVNLGDIETRENLQ